MTRTYSSKTFAVYEREDNDRVTRMSEHATEREGLASLQTLIDIARDTLADGDWMSGSADEWAARVYRPGFIPPISTLFMVEEWS
jgi:hypothetical protein